MSDLGDFIRHVHDPQTKALRRARARVRELDATMKRIADYGCGCAGCQIARAALAPAEQEGQR